MARPIVVVSRCLTGRACRYDGTVLHDPFIAKLAGFVTFRTVCPEMAIGLGVPRDPIRLVDSGGGARLLRPADGRDLTEKMRRFSRRFLVSLGPVDGFLLKARSPSCGVEGVKVWGRVARRGTGLFGGAVLEKFPKAVVVDEECLLDPAIRDRFLARLLASPR